MKRRKHQELKISGKFDVQGGVPMPLRPRPEERCKYPWDGMKVGDSFTVRVPVGMTPRNVQQALLANARYASGRIPGLTITTRNMGDGDVRVWRLG